MEPQGSESLSITVAQQWETALWEETRTTLIQLGVVLRKVSKILQQIPFFWARTSFLTFTFSFFSFNPKLSLYNKRQTLLLALNIYLIKRERKCYCLPKVLLYDTGTNLTWKDKSILNTRNRNTKNFEIQRSLKVHLYMNDIPEDTEQNQFSGCCPLKEPPSTTGHRDKYWFSHLPRDYWTKKQ